LIIKIYRYFGEQMQKTGRTVGMEIAPPLSPVTMPRPQPAKLESFFRTMKQSNVRLVVVVVPDKESYGKMLIMFYIKPPLQDTRFLQW
jgi:hypothetical protein